MDKVYEFRGILGISTDTYDVLGIPKLDEKIFESDIDDEKLIKVIKQFKGTFEQPLPPFSSFTIDRIPLFKWARMGRLNEIKIPSKSVTVSDIYEISLEKIKVRQLLESIVSKVESVDGDFRQNEIVKRWNIILSEYLEKELIIFSAIAHVSSGTYIRGIVNDIGVKMNTLATTLEIHRTRAGKFEIKDSVRL